MNIVTLIASTEAHAAEETHKAGLFEALGIDLRLLILQAVAFLLLVVLLGKFVYPILIRSIDKRHEDIEAGVKAAQEAEKKAAASEQKVAEALREARKQADEVIANGQKEANAMIEAAEAKAAKRAEHLVAEAKSQLDNDVRAARESLKKETVKLVASATEKIIKQKLDASADAKLVDEALKKDKA